LVFSAARSRIVIMSMAVRNISRKSPRTTCKAATTSESQRIDLVTAHRERKSNAPTCRG